MWSIFQQAMFDDTGGEAKFLQHLIPLRCASTVVSVAFLNWNKGVVGPLALVSLVVMYSHLGENDRRGIDADFFHKQRTQQGKMGANLFLGVSGAEEHLLFCCLLRANSSFLTATWGDPHDNGVSRTPE